MMSDIKGKYRTLVKRLYEKTIEDEVSWEQSWNSELMCSIGGQEIYLKATRNAEGEPVELIELRDDDSRVMDSITDEFIAGQPPGVPGFDTWFELMTSLHQTARRKALGVDAAVDRILKNLD